MKRSYPILSIVVAFVTISGVVLDRYPAQALDRNAPTPTPTPVAVAGTINPDTASKVQPVAHIGRGTISQVAWSPDGQTLAVGAGAGIWLYSASDLGAEPRLIGNYSTNVQSVAFSPDSKTIASASGYSVQLWDATSGKMLQTFNIQFADMSPRDTFLRLTSVAFSPDGKTVAASSATTAIWLWDSASGKLLQFLSGDTVGAAGSGMTSLAFSPDGNTIAAASDRGTLLWHKISSTGTTQWDIGATRLQTLSRIHGSINSVTFSPDGKTLASASNMGLLLWDTTSNGVLSTVNSPAGNQDTYSAANVTSVTFSPDGKTLATGSLDGEIDAWQLASGDMIQIQSGLKGGVNSIKFSPDGKTLAFSAGDQAVYVWDVTSKKLLQTLGGYMPALRSLAFSPDGQTLASSNADGNARLWTTATGNAIPRHDYV